jgi:hypothetical protein
MARPGLPSAEIATWARAVLFQRPKAGSTEAEWEDCAGYDPGDAGTRPARYVVVDGATEGYDALRWVRQLVTAFLGVDGSPSPPLTVAGMDAWFGRMQQQWLDEAPLGFATLFEERKFRETGSLATLVGCQVDGLGGPNPCWHATAVGDAVFFHVRDGRIIEQLPHLDAEDFDLNPDGVFTQPSERERMRAAVRLGSGSLRVGDQLLLTTDALAEWLIRTRNAGGLDALATVEHPSDFARLVFRERRRAGNRLKNDDVTLLRVEIMPSPADQLVVCR